MARRPRPDLDLPAEVLARGNRLGGGTILDDAELTHQGRRVVHTPVLDSLAVTWTLTSIAVFDMLVTTRGWSVERYEAWLAEALACALLPAA